MAVVFSYFYFFFFLFEKCSIKDGPSQEFFSNFSSIFLFPRVYTPGSGRVGGQAAEGRRAVRIGGLARPV
jgi:hypothetical protein